MLRKIRKGEWKRCAEMMSDIFIDYPLYPAAFGDSKNLKRRIYYLFCYELYEGQNYVYTDGENVVAEVRAQDGKEVSVARLFANPIFFFGFAFTVWKGLKAASDYIKFCDKYAKIYKQPSDLYIKNIGVAAAARGKGLLRASIDEICGDNGVFLETHVPQNVEIYKKLGFELLATEQFYGLNHYVMRRPSAAEKTKTV